MTVTEPHVTTLTPAQIQLFRHNGFLKMMLWLGKKEDVT